MEGRKKLNIADNELLFIIIIVKVKTNSVSCSQTWKKLDKGHKYVGGKKIMVCFPRDMLGKCGSRECGSLEQ